VPETQRAAPEWKKECATAETLRNLPQEKNIRPGGVNLRKGETPVRNSEKEKKTAKARKYASSGCGGLSPRMKIHAAGTVRTAAGAAKKREKP